MRSGILLFLGTIALTGLARVGRCAEAASSPGDPAGIAFFETRIRPLLAQNCYKCHSAEAAAAKKLKGGLYLDTREGVLKGGDNGPAIVAGKPGDSRLVTAVRWVDQDLKMPPKTRLPESSVADLEKWIAIGAPDRAPDRRRRPLWPPARTSRRERSFGRSGRFLQSPYRR